MRERVGIREEVGQERRGEENRWDKKKGKGVGKR